MLGTPSSHTGPGELNVTSGTATTSCAAASPDSVARADGCGALEGRTQAAATPIVLQDGEEVLKEGPAALARQEGPPEGGWDRLLRALRSYSSVHAGRLVLTPRRLIFVPTQQRDRPLTLEIAVETIESAHVCSIAIRRGLALALVGGARYYFLVRRPEDWLATVARVAGLDPKTGSGGPSRAS